MVQEAQTAGRGRSLLFVMNMQEGMVTPGFPEGAAELHLQKKTEAILEAIAQARACGTEIVWLFHGRGKNAAEHLPQRAKDWDWKAKLEGGDAPLAGLPIAGDDFVYIRPPMAIARGGEDDEAHKAFVLAGRPAIAGCGFYAEEPCRDGVYLWAHDLHEKGFAPVILEDLTDNSSPIAENTLAQMNITFLKRLKQGIQWVASETWLADVCAMQSPRFVAANDDEAATSTTLLPLHPAARLTQTGAKQAGSYRAKPPCGCAQALAA